MSLKIKLQNDIKQAMRDKNKDVLLVLRGLSAKIKQFEIDNKTDSDDVIFFDILSKSIKQHRESISKFELASRKDLIDKEKFELEVVSKYLPAQLTETEIANFIDEAIEETNAKSMADMGKIVGILKVKLPIGSDFANVSKLIKNKLQK